MSKCPGSTPDLVKTASEQVRGASLCPAHKNRHGQTDETTLLSTLTLLSLTMSSIRSRTPGPDSNGHNDHHHHHNNNKHGRCNNRSDHHHSSPETSLTGLPFGGALQPGLWKPYEHRKLANPVPLGLCGFATSCFVLSCVNLQARGVEAPNIAIPLALVYGGFCQVLAGMW